MSYWNVPTSYYRPPPAGTPGWQFAPVPGWGMNPRRAGPRRSGVGAVDPVRVNDDVLPDYSLVNQNRATIKAMTASLGGWGCQAVGAAGDQYRETTYGHVALASAASIAVGMLFGWTWCTRKPGRK